MEIDPGKGPEGIPLLSYVVVILLSAWGGYVHFVRRLRQSKRAATVAEFVGELATSSFTGVVVFLLCEASGIDRLMSAALCGISGHMGSRLLFQFDLAVEKHFRKVAGLETKPEDLTEAAKTDETKEK